MQNNDTSNYIYQDFTDGCNINYAVGIDYCPSDWISYHIYFPKFYKIKCRLKNDFIKILVTKNKSI